MSLKRYAMLAAISYHNQQNYNNKNNSLGVASAATTELLSITAAGAATSISPTAISPTAATTDKIINSNKSTLIQLKQQSQHQQQQETDIGNKTTLTQATITPLTISTSTTSTTTTPTRHLYNSDNPLFYSDHTHTNTARSGIDAIIGDDSASVESSESTNLNHDYVVNSGTSVNGGVGDGQRHQQQNTYGTTYYGSGFGVFHQQNIRSNGGGGGGIALITGGSGNSLGSSSYSNGINNNVNLLLGGAMLTLITTILCVVCYCCHRNIKKRTEAAYRQQRQWLENDPNMEIYSVEQCYETSGLFVGDSMDGLATIPALHHEPPPSYDAVVTMQEQQQLLMQQHQQQLIMQQQQHQQQQQQMMQQLPNNSPPPGYRSSLDISSMIQQQARNGLAMGALHGMETNSLASSTLNVRATTSRSPRDSLGNFNDLNGNLAMATTNQLPQTNYLRNKQQRTNLPPSANLTQLNMKKVLQAQSCCSLQRAEVENMWNAAAAALAARSAHNPTTESRTGASTSSPTLVMNTRKLSQDHAAIKTNTPETFGSRYLKQNYYRSGCPLCGKFRYDNDSTFSISMESNLDNLNVTAMAEENDRENRELNRETEQIRENSVNNNLPNTMDETDDNDEEDEVEVELEECSCNNAKRKQKSQKSTLKAAEQLQQNTYQPLAIQQDNENHSPEVEENNENFVSPLQTDDNCNNTIDPKIQAVETSPSLSSTSNNNNDSLTAASSSILPSTSRACSSTESTLPTVPLSPSVTIDLDCINENGIISLDMSKIIDKTGLPTYDAALKLESSGYV